MRALWGVLDILTKSLLDFCQAGFSKTNYTWRVMKEHRMQSRKETATVFRALGLRSGV